MSHLFCSMSWRQMRYVVWSMKHGQRPYALASVLSNLIVHPLIATVPRRRQKIKHVTPSPGGGGGKGNGSSPGSIAE